VVIATRDRRERLRETLVPLLADSAADEIVVVDDGSNDGSLELLEDLAAEHPRLQPVPSRHRGRAAARALGLERSSGEVVLLLDDDVVAAPGLVEGHARAHARGARLVVVGHMPIRLPAHRRPGDASTYLYAGNYEGSCAAAELAGRLRLWRVETNVVKLLRRVELQRGALDALEHS
jgi:glycosyltransferase involved in cell wall biosynthesis